MIHQIKIHSDYYVFLLNGSKRFELRFNDRDYKINDRLIIYELKNSLATGRVVRFKVTFVLSDYIGLQDGFVILSLEPYGVSLMDLPKLSD